MESGSSQTSYEYIAALRHDELADYAAEYCHESKEPRTIAAFKKVMNIIGPEAFRSELATFVGECTAGEEPRSRGAAFMARLKSTEEARGPRCKK